MTEEQIALPQFLASDSKLSHRWLVVGSRLGFRG